MEGGDARLLWPAAVLWRLTDSLSLNENAPADATTAPRVSVIMPARDEALKSARCVNSLSTKLLRAMEIMVVDDHSTDDTAAITRATAGNGASAGAH